MYKPFVNKKNIQSLLDKPVYKYIEEQSAHHIGLLEVSMRLTEMAGINLMSGKTRFVDIVLSHAISSWHITSNKEGISAAYKEFCHVVFNSLSQVFDYTVTGKSKVLPCYAQTWDCTSKTYFQWITEEKVDPLSVNVVYAPAVHKLDDKGASYILSSKIFSRQDMVNLGLASEIHTYLDDKP
jgi:hypothetical protein